MKNGASLEYQYAIADHQGNTRVVFSSVTPALDAGSTGFESDPGTLENFPSGGNLSSMALYNHTPGGTKSQLLNGGHNSQVGVAKSFAVYPGDKVKITAYAKYASGGSSTATGFATALLQAFSLEAPAPGEVGTPSAALNTWGGFVDGGAQEDNEYPQAFVNIIVYDKDHNFLDAAWDQVDAGAEQVGVTPNVAHDQMTKEYTVKEAGFVYLYVSNNSPVNVYFDDVSITHTPTNVIQYSEYYPFGLQTSTSWTREDHSNDYLYNAGNELNPTTGWYEMFYRSYDPAIGRMLQVDPYAAMYASHTGYNYGVNNPVMMNDPSGGQAEAPPPGVSVSSWNRIQRLQGRDYSMDFENWYDDPWSGGGGGSGNRHGANWAPIIEAFQMGTSLESIDYMLSNPGGYLVETNEGIFYYTDRSFQSEFEGGGIENWYMAMRFNVGAQQGAISLLNSSQQAIMDQFVNAIYDARSRGSSTNLAEYFKEYSLSRKSRKTEFAKIGFSVKAEGYLNLRDGKSPIKAVITFAPSENWSIIPSTPNGPQGEGTSPIDGPYNFLHYYYEGTPSNEALLITGFTRTQTNYDRFTIFIWGY